MDLASLGSGSMLQYPIVQVSIAQTCLAAPEFRSGAGVFRPQLFVGRCSATRTTRKRLIVLETLPTIACTSIQRQASKDTED